MIVKQSTQKATEGHRRRVHRVIKSKILRHENQLASQADREVLRDTINELMGIGITLDREVEIRQEVRDEAEGFVDWGLLQVASDCLALGQLLIEDEFDLGKGSHATHIKRFVSQFFDYVKEHCENFEHEIHEDAEKEGRDE